MAKMGPLTKNVQRYGLLKAMDPFEKSKRKL